MEQLSPAGHANPVLASAQEADVATVEFGPRDFRNALGRFATGITVVTMCAPEADEGEAPQGQAGIFGITVNAFMSVSLEPPLVAVSIDKRARAHATLLGAERFGVSVLAEGQQRLSDAFAGRPVQVPDQPFERFAGFPVLRGALTQLVLSTHQVHDAGDHTIFIGQVEALRYSEGQPLLFSQGQYEQLPAAQPIS
jgi:flavin reductase (DIM6/NTAB) family NADH-FMN oxidoreductase RutF